MDWDAVDRIEGWFTFETFCLWRALLGAQKRPGDLLEIGVFKGRSASVLAAHRKDGERLILCDPMLAEGAPAGLEGAEIVAESSSRLSLAKSSVRFAHIDGDHSGYAVAGDLSTCDAALTDGGLVVLDDFFSPQYPQVTAATYEWLTLNPRRLVPLLVGFNKAYLCRPAAYVRWQQFVVTELEDAMRAAGFPVTLCKTSSPEDNLTFGVYPYRDDLGPRNGKFRVIGTT